MGSQALCRWVLAIFVAGASGACARHVRLEVPDTTPGSRYTCRPSHPCTPATVDNPALLNQSGTAFVILPRQCAGRIHRIVVLDAGSSNPEVDVTCAPIEDHAHQPIEEMK